MGKIKMTVGQAVVKFLNNQYVEMDGEEHPFVDGIFTIFGHGMVVGLGQALDEDPGRLRVYQGRSEQGMAHAAIGYAKQNNRRRIIACSSSIGPGATNMVTAALTATINNIPFASVPVGYLCDTPAGSGAAADRASDGSEHHRVRLLQACLEILGSCESSGAADACDDQRDACADQHSGLWYRGGIFAAGCSGREL